MDIRTRDITLTVPSLGSYTLHLLLASVELYARFAYAQAPFPSFPDPLSSLGCQGGAGQAGTISFVLHRRKGGSMRGEAIRPRSLVEPGCLPSGPGETSPSPLPVPGGENPS